MAHPRSRGHGQRPRTGEACRLCAPESRISCTGIRTAWAIRSSVIPHPIFLTCYNFNRWLTLKVWLPIQSIHLRCKKDLSFRPKRSGGVRCHRIRQHQAGWGQIQSAPLLHDHQDAAQHSPDIHCELTRLLTFLFMRKWVRPIHRSTGGRPWRGCGSQKPWRRATSTRP